MTADERRARNILRPRTGLVAVAPVEVPIAWYEIRGNLATLWEWLEDRGEQPDDVAYFIEKAHKWTPEYRAMCAELAAAGDAA